MKLHLQQNLPHCRFFCLVIICAVWPAWPGFRRISYTGPDKSRRERERDGNYICKLSAVMSTYLPNIHPVALQDRPPQIAGNEGRAHLLHGKNGEANQNLSDCPLCGWELSPLRLFGTFTSPTPVTPMSWNGHRVLARQQHE